MSDRIRCGDHVLHRPSGETWVVAFADYETGRLAWCGWPEGLAEISDCEVTRKACDEAHAKLAREIGEQADMRGRGVRRLYPEIFEQATAETDCG